jgi:hypothetical protein
MKRFLVLVALVGLVTPAYAADLATPTATAALATPAATASPDGSQRTDTQSKRLGGDRVERADTFEAGLQIGTTAAGASLLTFAKRGKCTLNLPSIAAVPTPAPTPATSFGFVPALVKVSCAATGVAVGDLVLHAGLDVMDTGTTNYEALRLSRCKVSAADTLSCWLHYTGPSALDPGALTLEYLVVR